MKYPESLKKNGTIGFCAPSFGASVEPYKTAFDRAIDNLKKEGFNVYLGPNCYEGKGVGISNLPKLCGKELTEIYCGKESDAVISVGGGELMCEILDYVDFEKIKASKPKWFMGYSDNTNFTFLLTVLCDVASVYGPNASSFGMEPGHKSLKDALKILKGTENKVTNYDKWEINEGDDSPTAPYNCTEEFCPELYDAKGKKTDSVKMSGRLIGGCLDVLNNLCGTKYDKVQEFCEKYREDGIIWFLESCDLTTMDGRRALWHLKESGWFKYTKGFIFGRPYLYDNQCCGLNWEDAISEHIACLGVPYIRNADLGHLPPMMPVISGSIGEISAFEKSINISYLKK